MVKMSKKVIGAITGVSTALIVGSTVAANLLIKSENGSIVNPNPLGRDKTYHYYSLVNKISNNSKLNNLISIQKIETGIVYIIEEQKFIDNIKTIVQEALKSIPAFSQDYLNYIIDCHYKINTKSVLVDLVWYKQNTNKKYFDQFELILQSA